MSIIGNFKRDTKTDTYTGEIVTLTFSRKDVHFTPNQKSGEKQPDYRIVGKTAHGSVEFGSAWKKTSEKGPFLSVSIDDPALSGTLNAALFDAKDGDTATLRWTRPKAKK
jgi:uncharacterized protein (DUF736 family)